MCATALPNPNPATEVNPAPKRARFSETDEISTKPSAPSSAAKDRVTSALASLLLPQTKQLAEFHCAKINTLHAKVVRQQKTLTTLAIEDFIPRSARFGFELTASQLTARHPVFTTLATKAKERIAEFQIEMKEFIVSVAELELSNLKKEYAATILRAVVVYATAFILAKTGSPAKESKLAVYVTYAFSTVVLKYAKELNNDEMTSIYTTVSNFTAPKWDDVHILTNPATTTLLEFCNECRSLFVMPQEAFTKAEKANLITLALHKLTSTSINMQVSEETTAAMELEPSVAPAQLASLIDASVKKATTELRAKIAKLESKTIPKPKNSTGGAGRASEKKKSPEKKKTTLATVKPKKKPTKNRPHAADPKADDAASVTPAPNTKSGASSHGRNKSGAKKQQSSKDGRNYRK